MGLGNNHFPTLNCSSAYLTVAGLLRPLWCSLFVLLRCILQEGVAIHVRSITPCRLWVGEGRREREGEGEDGEEREEGKEGEEGKYMTPFQATEDGDD